MRNFIIGFLSFAIGVIWCLGMCGCSPEPTNDIAIKQTRDAWKVEDVVVKEIPSEAYVVGLCPEGIYYRQDEELDAAGESVRIQYHFLAKSGEAKLLYQEDAMTEGSYCSYHLFQNDLLIAESMEGGAEGIRVVRLTPYGEAEEIFRQNARQLPIIQTSGEKLLFLVNNYLDQDYYENKLILYNPALNEQTVICQAVYHLDQLDGEDIMSVSLSDKEIFYTVQEKEGDDLKFWFLDYDIAAQKVISKTQIGRKAFYAVCLNGYIFLSENDDEIYIEEAGSIGRDVNGVFRENKKLPGVSASDMVRYGQWVDGGIFFKTYHTGYFWNQEKNTIYVYDFMQMDDVEEQLSGFCITEQGFMSLIMKQGQTFIRNVTCIYKE